MSTMASVIIFIAALIFLFINFLTGGIVISGRSLDHDNSNTTGRVRSARQAQNDPDATVGAHVTRAAGPPIKHQGAVSAQRPGAPLAREVCPVGFLPPGQIHGLSKAKLMAKQLKIKLMDVTRMPGVVGFFDGTHVKCQRHFQFEEAYVNRKCK